MKKNLSVSDTHQSGITAEKDGHHIRCLACGIVFCDKDREGDALPLNFCPNCGIKFTFVAAKDPAEE